MAPRAVRNSVFNELTAVLIRMTGRAFVGRFPKNDAANIGLRLAATMTPIAWDLAVPP
jgi:hypothetical protein